MVVGYRNLGGVIKLTPDDARLAKFKTMLKLHLPKQVVVHLRYRMLYAENSEVSSACTYIFRIPSWTSNLCSCLLAHACCSMNVAVHTQALKDKMLAEGYDSAVLDLFDDAGELLPEDQRPAARGSAGGRGGRGRGRGEVAGRGAAPTPLGRGKGEGRGAGRGVAGRGRGRGVGGEGSAGLGGE